MTERTHAARLWRLDAVRGAAAVYVAAGHITRHQFPPGGWLNRSLAFGQEAVIVFFLLSGFVIHWSMQTRPAQSFGSYLRQRALRIYPLFILTLLVAALIGWAKETHDPRLGWPTFVGNLLMLQDFALAKPNTWVDVYGGVSTLWSLSYEWWFYLLYFPICRRIPAPWQSRWVAAISLSQLAVYLIWPNFASRVLIYFSIWWVGVELARWYFAPSEISRRTAVTAIATVALAALVLGFNAALNFSRNPGLRLGLSPVLEFRHFFAAVALTILALGWHHFGWKFFRPTLGIFAWFAPVSYALYLLHEPLGVQLPWAQWLPATTLRVPVTFLTVLAAAVFAEHYLQPRLRAFFSR